MYHYDSWTEYLQIHSQLQINPTFDWFNIKIQCKENHSAQLTVNKKIHQNVSAD